MLCAYFVGFEFIVLVVLAGFEFGYFSMFALVLICYCGFRFKLWWVVDYADFVGFGFVCCWDCFLLWLG